MKFWESEKGLRITVLAVLLVTVGGSVLMSPLVENLRTKKPLDTQDTTAGEVEGVWMETQDTEAYLEGLEAQDLNAVQEQIKLTREELSVSQSDAEDLAQLSWAKRFEHSVVMGDSIAVGFLDFKYLDATSVVATTGISMKAAVAEVDVASELAPEHVFLYYGFNDIGHVGDNYDRFRKEFVTLVETIQEKIPDADIYVNSLFQPLPDNLTMNGYYNDVSPYNDILKEECEERGIVYLDNVGMTTEADFAKDGYHLQAGFYDRWLQVMAEAAGI